MAVLGSLVYSGDIVLAITGDKIDSGKISLLLERALDEVKQFKHVEAPKEINVAVLRSLFELLGLPSGLAQMATQGKEEPVKELLDAVAKQVQRVLTVGTDLQNRLSFWGQSLLREEELRDWRTRLEALKGFLEGLSPYNTVGKLKNLRITQDDIDTQRKNLEVLASVEKLRDLVAELGTTAAYLSQAEMVLATNHAWVQQAQAARKDILDNLADDRSALHASEYRQRLATLKKEYITAYVTQHSKARLGVVEDKTKTALRRDPRITILRALAGISLMPTGQLTAFEDKLDKLKSCASLVESELAASPVCPHCSFRPANEQGDLLPAATVLKTLDDELDRLLQGWQQTLLDNLDDPIIQANFELLKAAQRDLIKGFLASKALPDPVTPQFVATVQEALSGLEKIVVTSDDIKKALLTGGSPATPEDLRKRFEWFMNERCKGIHRHRVSDLQSVGLQDAANSFSNYAVWPSSEFSIFQDAQLDRLKRHHRKKRGPHGLPPIRSADHNQLTPGVGRWLTPIVSHVPRSSNSIQRLSFPSATSLTFPKTANRTCHGCAPSTRISRCSDSSRVIASIFGSTLIPEGSSSRPTTTR